MQELNEKIAGSDSLGSFDSLADSIQKRIDAVDAAQQLNADLAGDADLADLEAKYAAGGSSPSSAAQDELAALKAKLNGGQ